MSEKKNDGRVKRRRLLQAAGGIGAFAGFQGTVFGESERQRRVPRTLDMDGNAKTTMKVPKEWHNHFKSVQVRKEDFDEEYIGTEGVKSTSILPSEESYRGKQELKFKLYHTEEFEREVDEYRGIEVITEEIDRSEDSESGIGALDHDDDEDCYYNNHNWPTILGAIPFWNEREPDRTDHRPSGTTTWEVEFEENRYIQTARHVFGTCASDDLTGVMTHQHDRKMGQTVHENKEQDVALISPDEQDYYEIDNQIINEDGTDAWPIVGVHTNLSLVTLIMNNEPVRKVGTTTGRTSGMIEETRVTRSGEGCTYDGDGVRAHIEINSGDSGGPVFTGDKSEGAELAFMVSFPWGGQQTEDIGECEDAFPGGQGPAAYRLQDEGFTPVQE